MVGGIPAGSLPADEIDPPPSDRFMFVIRQDHAGFSILTTTNI
jgi:hypothetical protein